MKYSIIICLLLLVSCSSTIKKEDLNSLNGYWEIEKVTTKNNETKVYEVNTTVDFIKLNQDLSGTRQKVLPQVDGTYITNFDSETFIITNEENTYTLEYKNKLSEWNETLNQISSNHFSVTNTDGITYYYKRYTPIDVKDEQ